MQRMEQASKALNLCVSQGEFEGSTERVEGERLLLEATHKYRSAWDEFRRIKNEGAVGQSSSGRVASGLSRGSISISGLSLPLKAEFVRMVNNGSLGDAVHYFLVLVKHRQRVIATQMLSTVDGISNGRLAFPNLINMRDLDFDFQVIIFALSLNRPFKVYESIKLMLIIFVYLSDLYRGLWTPDQKGNSLPRGQISHPQGKVHV